MLLRIIRGYEWLCGLLSWGLLCSNYGAGCYCCCVAGRQRHLVVFGYAPLGGTGCFVLSGWLACVSAMYDSGV